MTPKKKTGDPVTDLPATSRKVLEKAPPSGRFYVPYTVGRRFALNGWGEHQGKSSGGGIPLSLFQLNEKGLEAAGIARQRTRDAVDAVTYAAVHESTTAGMDALLEAAPLDELIGNAEALIERAQASGQSAAGARGYLDALVKYRDEQASVTA